jgi:dinuclear metal center YbgI/SA1388 family protein
MRLSALIKHLESIAPLSYQEDYDNAGLLVGSEDQEVNSALVSLDCTEAIVDEAIAKGCDLIISHHPIVFKGLKKLNGKNYVERVILKAIKHGIALYASHTNLDSVPKGVNKVICDRLGIKNPVILNPKSGILKKLVTFCPTAHAEALKTALFAAGAGEISNYSECSFSSVGTGTFKGNLDTNPFVGTPGLRHLEGEHRIEVVFKRQDERKLLLALFETHPYEEVAYDIYGLDNKLGNVGSGMIGWLGQELDGNEFLELVKNNMQAKVIRHTALLPGKIKKVAVCGGSGSFLLKNAIAAGADAFVTADFKYHEFFDSEQKLMITDIGHFETEQFTSNLLIDIIREKFPNFAIRLTEHNTNPINYYF